MTKVSHLHHKWKRTKPLRWRMSCPSLILWIQNILTYVRGWNTQLVPFRWTGHKIVHLVFYLEKSNQEASRTIGTIEKSQNLKKFNLPIPSKVHVLEHLHSWRKAQIYILWFIGPALNMGLECSKRRPLPMRPHLPYNHCH